MNRPRVFVVKEQMIRTNNGGSMPMDYSPATCFGDLHFITSHDMPFHPRSTIQQAWNSDVLDFVKTYDPTKDYIILTGQPTAMFCIGWALGKVGKTPRFLVWRREENQYRVMHFDTDMPQHEPSSGLPQHVDWTTWIALNSPTN